MAKADNRPKITLACTECQRRNYNTVKNKVNDRDRIELEEVLPLVPEAHPAPRDPLTAGRSAGPGSPARSSWALASVAGPRRRGLCHRRE